MPAPVARGPIPTIHDGPGGAGQGPKPLISAPDDNPGRHLADVAIADAVKTKGLAPLAAKTDKIDARVLAELARRDLVRRSGCPTRPFEPSANELAIDSISSITEPPSRTGSTPPSSPLVIRCRSRISSGSPDGSFWPPSRSPSPGPPRSAEHSSSSMSSIPGSPPPRRSFGRSAQTTPTSNCSGPCRASAGSSATRLPRRLATSLEKSRMGPPGGCHASSDRGTRSPEPRPALPRSASGQNRAARRGICGRRARPAAAGRRILAPAPAPRPAASWHPPPRRGPPHPGTRPRAAARRIVAHAAARNRATRRGSTRPAEEPGPGATPWPRTSR